MQLFNSNTVNSASPLVWRTGLCRAAEHWRWRFILVRLSVSAIVISEAVLVALMRLARPLFKTFILENLQIISRSDLIGWLANFGCRASEREREREEREHVNVHHNRVRACMRACVQWCMCVNLYAYVSDWNRWRNVCRKRSNFEAIVMSPAVSITKLVTLIYIFVTKFNRDERYGWVRNTGSADPRIDDDRRRLWDDSERYTTLVPIRTGSRRRIWIWHNRSLRHGR